MGSDRSGGDGMPTSRAETTPKRIKPRIVLGLLLAGSFAGVWLAHSGSAPGTRVVRWTVIASIGLLTGGLYWRLVLYETTDFDDDEPRLTVDSHWRRLETIAIWGLVAGGVATVAFTAGNFGTMIGAAVLGGVPLAVGLWFWIGRTADAVGGDTVVAPRPILFVVMVGMLCGVAWLETRTGPFDWAVRVGHLGSFALWLGGAAWHNGVVLPIVRSEPTTASALQSQARRFRRHLPGVIALFVLTGLYQTVGLVGPSIPSPTSPVGSLLWFKVLVLLALTGLVLVTMRHAGSTPAD